MKRSGAYPASLRRRLAAFVALSLLAASIGSAQGEDPPGEAPAPKPRVAILPITGTITDVTRDFLVDNILDAQRQGVEVVVFDLNTPGGLVSSALSICHFIKNLELRTVAWVNPNAYSAGSMIAVACDEIVMAKFSSIGDSAPIMVGPGGVQEIGETERAKQESPILKEFRESAELNGYPLPLVESMVRLGPAIYWIEFAETGERKFVYETDLDFYQLSPADAALAADEAPKTGDAGWRMVRKVYEADELVTLGRQQAIEYGFAKRVINNTDELAEHLGVRADEFVAYRPTWSQDIAAFFSNPAIRGLLLIVVLVAGYLELQSPGVGLPGAVALVGLIVFLGGPMVAGLASVMDVALVLVGVALLVVELFVIPGFGVFGLAGLVLMFLGIVLSFVGPEPGEPIVPKLPYSLQQLETGVLVVLTSTVVGAGLIAFLSRYFGSIPLLNKMILAPAGSGGEVVATDLSGRSLADKLAIGAVGEATTDLRPSGTARFDATLVDVVTPGSWIEKDRAVKIVEITGNVVVVEEA